MATERNGYQPLFRQCDDDKAEFPSVYGSQAIPASKSPIRALIVVAILSCVGNLLWAFQSLQGFPSHDVGRERSLYAGLERDVPMPYRDDTIFGSHNRSLADAAWNSWAVDPGIVALPHDWVRGRMLPQARSWPWDKDKGIYLLNGFHSLHCLQFIRQSLLDASDGISQLSGRTLEHNLHCIESLRQDTLCHADDTPRYTGYSKKEVSGVMQTRMCRNWDKLEAWARDHTACYRDIGRDDIGFPQIEKYKFCPEGYTFSATGSPTPPWLTGSGVSHPGDE